MNSTYALCPATDNLQVDFKVAYRFQDSHRTSNMLDRLMNHQDRLLFNMRYFHGNKESAKQYLRSMALIWNFHPYGARTCAKDSSRHSPFVDLNGWSYHDNWLHNLLIASSMNGRRPAEKLATHFHPLERDRFSQIKSDCYSIEMSPKQMQEN